MYSQRDEEKIILEHAPENGRLLDIGAYNGIAFSNSRALIERGWQAVLVEPSPLPFFDLCKSAPDRDDVIKVNALITPVHESPKTFFCTADATSTTERGNYVKWAAVAKFIPIIVRPMSVAELIFTVRGLFDFISIDTEGNSFEILKAIPLSLLKTKLVCVEMDGNELAITSHLSSQGFEIIHKTDENLIAKRS